MPVNKISWKIQETQEIKRKTFYLILFAPIGLDKLEGKMKNGRLVCILSFALILISQGIAQTGAWYLYSDNGLPSLSNGCAITCGGNDTLYAIKGNNSRVFYAYVISRDTWKIKDSVPRKVGDGGALTRVQTCSLYVVTGRDSSYFYLYRTDLDEWYNRESAPGGFSGGAALCWAGRDTIYAFRGGQCKDFYKFIISQDTWIRAIAESLPSIADYGAGMCWAGEPSKFYAIFGGYTSSFYKYDPQNYPTPWFQLTSPGINWQEGASLVWDGGNKIYAVVGGGRDSVLVYNISAGEWSRIMKTPNGIGGNDEGAGLLAWDNRTSQQQLYLLEGGNSNHYYRYCLPLVSKLPIYEDFESKQFPKVGWQSKPENTTWTYWKRVFIGPPHNRFVAEYDYGNNYHARLITPKYYLGSELMLVNVQFDMFNTAEPGNDSLVIEYYKNNTFNRITSYPRYDASSPGYNRKSLFFETSDTIMISFHGYSHDNYPIRIDNIGISYAVSEKATYPNQGRHLLRNPNSSTLHRVYTGGEKVLYSMSTDWGQSWSIPSIVDDGECPAIALSSDGTPWILYADLDLAGAFRCAVRRPNGTWKIRTIFEAEESKANYNVGPSLVLATISNEEGDLGYGVFSDNYDRIFFVAFDTIRNYGEPPYQVIDEHSPCLAPSISITPSDLLHVVWQRGNENEGSIYYKASDKIQPHDIRHDILPDWSREVRISETPYPTEPASNPSTEAYGEYVYAAWRGPNADGNFPGDIWRRARWVPNDDPESWDDPRNMSETQDNESNFPVMYTDFATVWQEQVSDTNWDIYGNIGDYTGPLFETPKSSKYPHTDGYWDPMAPSATFYCNTIWTEETLPSLYIVKFGRYQYNPAKSFFEHPYYTVKIGDSVPSPYCVQRTGYFRYNHYTIDFGNQKLKYKLPYLHPKYYYDLQAIIYQKEQNNWMQSFYIDSTLQRAVSFRPNRPETVRFRIPKESYENDAEILQEIRKTIGVRAVIADLKLYQIEVMDSSSKCGSQSVGVTSIPRPLLYQSYPNPFKSQTAICYSLPTECKVTLSVYDISGRVVRTLVNQHQTSNIYSVNWDGRDDTGRTLAQGVYFYRIRTERFTDTKRMVLIR